MAAFSEFDVWDFKRDDRGRWIWERVSPDGEILLKGVASFYSLEECVDDARRRGYSGSFDLVTPHEKEV